MLEELAARSYAVVEEPGRRIAKQELTGGGERLPWNNLAAFAQAALDLALDDHRNAKHKRGIVFFDRGIVDAAAALVELTADPVVASLLKARHYNENIFLAPPWPEIYEQDNERRHAFSDAVAEYERLLTYYSEAGYLTHVLPKTSLAERADFVIDTLSIK